MLISLANFMLIFFKSKKKIVLRLIINWLTLTKSVPSPSYSKSPKKPNKTFFDSKKVILTARITQKSSDHVTALKPPDLVLGNFFGYERMRTYHMVESGISCVHQWTHNIAQLKCLLHARVKVLSKSTR